MEAAAEKPKAEGGADPSMEEILQSIRKIIAEDDKDGSKPGENGAAAPVAAPKEPEGAVGSDVLELTEMVKDDGSVVSLKDAAPADVLSKIDQALTPEKPMEKPAEKPPEQPAAPVAVAAPAAAPAPKPEVPKPAAPAEALLSADAAAAASSSLKTLKTAADPEPPPVKTSPSPAMASGQTVEGMVMDMLRPMIKSWLDTNLPAIVQNIVEREVKKLTK